MRARRGPFQREAKIFTNYDKAIGAVIMGILSIIALAGGLADTITEEWVAGIIAVLTPIVVYLLPNKQR